MSNPYYYSDQQRRWLTKNIKNYTHRELTAKFNAKFNAARTKTAITSYCERMDIMRGDAKPASIYKKSLEQVRRGHRC